MRIKNLKFVEGYALQMLENSEVLFETVFFSSTACLFTPKELEKYLLLMKEVGVKSIVINEPTWGNPPFSKANALNSYHLEGGVWAHNYPFYLKKYQFINKEDNSRKYQHPQSNRNDIYLNIGLSCQAP